MTKTYWKNADELVAAPNVSVPASHAGRGDEFGPEVARAIADLRTKHGVTNASCETEGNTTAELDRLRDELKVAVPGLNRRGFMQISGAAAVFALAACGKKHPDTLVPWAQQPEGTTLGNAVYYSTTLRDSGEPVGVVVKTYDGRPIKIEGNIDHPLSRGRCDTQTQAALLNLYDPDRLQDGPHQRDADAFKPITWDVLDAAVGNALKSGTVGLLTGAIDGPAAKRLLQDLAAAFPKRFMHAACSAFPRVGEAQARKLSFGQASLPSYRADLAEVMVSFGDFLGSGTTGLAEQVEFGDLRRLKTAAAGDAKRSGCGQVIAFEPTMSQLGSVSDVRVRVAAEQLAVAAWGVAEAVTKQLGIALPTSAAKALDAVRGSSLEDTLKLVPIANAGSEKTAASPLAYAAERLVAAKKAGKHSLVWAGGASQQGEDSVSLHLAVAYLNATLGNEGVTVVSSGDAGAIVDTGAAAELLKACADGAVDVLIVAGANPAYAWPASVPALKKVKTLVVLADRIDETAILAHFVAPTLHGLESWGDAEARPGIFSLQQPCIPPLWDCRASEESLMAFAVAAGVQAFAREKTSANPAWISIVARKPLWQAAAHGVASWQDMVRATWIDTVKTGVAAAADDRSFWNAALSRGVVLAGAAAGSHGKAAAAPAASSWGYKGDVTLSATPNGLRLVLNASRTMRDGANLNNAWLQEMPDPVSKVTWDNYLAMSPTDAHAQGIASHDVVTLAITAGESITAPVHVQEGQHPGTLELFLGWGRERAGQVADICPTHEGFRINAFALSAQRPLPLALGATVTRTGAVYQLANVQGHDYMEGRPVALDEVLAIREREIHEVEQWEKGTDGKPGGDVSMWGTHHAYAGHKWGMAVDMNTCIGCNACVVACHAENNVPVVGRDEVRKGRVMHWIRIDRYYSGSFDKDAVGPIAVRAKQAEALLDVEVVNQPVMCQQCENAPCEPVCPANATMHNNEGISLQIYNRCVGTRYCANNCPYKVRRFNWYQYSQYRAGPIDAGKPLTRIVTNLRTSGATSSQSELSHAPLEMMLNPEVTVRHRGVMEKCNFCIQRTRTIRDIEHGQNRRIKDGEVQTACAQTCPTKALVFGDLNDPQSEVVQMVKRVGTGYRLLDKELNTRPSVSYLKRVRNRPATVEEQGAGAEHAGAKAGEG